MVKTKKAVAKKRTATKEKAPKRRLKKSTALVVRREATPKRPVIQGSWATSGEHAAVAAHPDNVSAFLAFGVAGAGLTIATILLLDLLRPAAQAFGARLAQAVSPQASDADAERLLAAKLKSSPDSQRATLEAVRRLLDSLAPEVAEPLALLAAEYVEEGKAPDGFFRGAARLLSDITGEEFASLQSLLRVVQAYAAKRDEDEITIMYAPLTDSEAPTPDHVHYSRPDERGDGYGRWWADLGALDVRYRPQVRRVLQLLTLNALGYDATAGGLDGYPQIGIPAMTLQRLAAVFG